MEEPQIEEEGDIEQVKEDVTRQEEVDVAMKSVIQGEREVVR